MGVGMGSDTEAALTLPGFKFQFCHTSPAHLTPSASWWVPEQGTAQLALWLAFLSTFVINVV